MNIYLVIGLSIYFGVMILIGIVQRIGHHADKSWAKEINNPPMYLFWPLIIVGIILFCIWWVLNQSVFMPVDWLLKRISKLI